MPSLTTDFNVSPYFDDYEAAMKYYRVLFRPSVAVQARELTQAATMQQEQIERFANHIFKDGSVVEGCSPTEYPNLDFIRVADEFANTNFPGFSADLTSDYLLVGQTSNVRAVAISTKTGVVANYPDTNRFYVKYLSTGISDAKVFANGETISIYSTSQSKLGTLSPANLLNTVNVITTNSSISATGKGYGFGVESGVIYHKGFFQIIDNQVIIMKDYDQDVGNYVVGFDTKEEIITEVQDQSLLDNALGYSNENAPGAHRLKLTPVLVSRNRADIVNNENFFAAFEFSNVSNSLVLNKTKTPYDNLGEIINKRTFDESGDYITKPFLTESISTANSQTFSYQVSPGKGYIHGAEVEYIASRSVEVEKATTTKEALDQIITTNYGNFVYVKEYSGALNFTDYITVDIYDTGGVQAVTNRHTPSLVGKNKVGTAKVKSVLHNSGDHGAPNTTYRVYLSDITMNSGKSFNADAKFLYANSSINTFGPFYADLVLQGSSAVIQTSGKSSLVFPFGKSALKNLRSSGGTVNSTEFYFRASSSAVLQTNGTATVTTPSPFAGGTEKIGYSSGILGDSLEDDFLVVVAANTSTANIAGTINVSSATNMISTTGLNTYFANNEFIKIQSGGTIEYRRVSSVNSIAMVIDSPTSFTNTTSTFAKHYPAGYTIPLSNGTYPGTRQINVTSDTTFDINIGSSVAAAFPTTGSVTVQYTILRSSATQAKKDVNKTRYVKLYANNSANNSWNLGLADVYNLKKVYANNSGFTENSSDDITSKFVLDTGQQEDYYDHAKLVLKPQYYNTLGDQYLTVVLDHFTSNTSSGVGFFSVDSYPIDDANTANTSAIQTYQIPTYNSKAGSFDLRDCVDFRSYKANTANSATSLSLATLNPATTTNFVAPTIKYLSQPDTNFNADITYYLGRYDLVTINSTGGLGVTKGTPAENPTTPSKDVDSMVIASAYVPPYPTLPIREAQAAKRPEYGVKTTLETNRGFTMRDIGVLEKRIDRLEYYTTLNLLEQSAQNIQVADATGLNRFKNGIFADPMNSHINGNVSDIEYRWSIDPATSYGRPLFSSENVDLAYNSSLSTGVSVSGKGITLPFTHELYINQPYATKVRNNTQDMWSWNGSMDLYPSYDMNRDETQLPNVNASIDLTQPFEEFADAISDATGATIFGTRWGDWRTTSSSTKTTSTTTNDFGGILTTTTAKTTSNQLRSGTSTFISPVTQTIDLGKFVTDVSIQPFMKSRVVAIVAKNLKPNTKLYAFFDDTNVSQYCAPAALNTAIGATLPQAIAAAQASGKPEDVLKRTAAYGSQLTSDASGTLYAVFNIPASTFRTGDRQLQLIDVNDLVVGSDAAITKASATYTASNIAVSSRNATVTTVTPDIQQRPITDKRVITSTTVRQSFRPRGGDPIAQGFYIDAAEEQSGVFVSKMDLFFKRKDPTLGLTVYVVGMSNGYPDSATVYGSGRVEAAGVSVSDNASLATTFTFKQPIFLSANKEYAFYVAPDGNSPEYQMWMSETGGVDIITGAQVYQNPYTSDAFRSSNSGTWSVLEKEDIKFNLYVANFTVGSGTVYFQNENDEFFKYTGLAVADSAKPLMVGQEVYYVNSAANVAIVNADAHGYIQSFDTTNSKLRIDSSNGGFIASKTIGIFAPVQQGNVAHANATSLIATATISEISNPIVHSIVPRFASVQPAGSTIDYSFIGTSNSGVIETSYNTVSNDEEREMLDMERRVYSKSNETGGKTLTVKATLTTTNKYISPVIDMSRKSVLAIQNLVNNDNTNEHTRYGSAAAKYISKPVILDEGQDAEDIKVYLTGYRPFNTDIEVYIKFLNSQDSSDINSKVWTKLTNDSEGLRSSPIDILDFKEFVYSVPSTAPVTNAAFKNASNFGIVEYTDASGAIYRSYKTFAIKIVLLSSNGIYVPKVNDVRAIALQV